MSLKRLCKCGKAIDWGMKCCEACRKKAEQARKDYHKYYDANVRDEKTAAFYNSTEWVKTREYVLAKYKGLDLYAFFIQKRIVYADTVHHIEELKENWDRRLDINNLFPLSNENHNRIHKLYLKDKKGTQKLLFSLLARWREEYGG